MIWRGSIGGKEKEKLEDGKGVNLEGRNCRIGRQALGAIRGRNCDCL